MSNEFLQAADDARKLLRGFAAVQQVADAFDKAGSAVQAQAEAEAALEATKPKLLKAKEAVEKAKQAAIDAQVQADQIRADAQAEAAAIVVAAKGDAASIVAVADEHRKAQETLLESAVLSISVETTAKIAERDAMILEVTDLERRADEARAYLAKLAG